jgi:hypothetical protein
MKRKKIWTKRHKLVNYGEDRCECGRKATRNYNGIPVCKRCFDELRLADGW